MLFGMMKPMSNSDRLAAALQVYADAIRLDQVPAPNYLNLHTAAMTWAAFMALADRLGARITINEPGEASWIAYASIALPFGAGILPDDIRARVVASTSVGVDQDKRIAIADHNAWCAPIDLVPAEIDPCANGACTDPEMHAEGGHDR
jgi:hypothetical protein